MLKRLWQIFGPVICALVLVVVVIYAYPQGRKYSYEAEKRSAVTLTNENFKSRKNKTTALSDQNHRFVPFFGSSEWLRFDALHPAVLAEKYDRNYRPYFIGQRGSASLNHYLGMQQMLPELQNGTAVYVLSPQWFTKKGYNSAAFQQFFNNDQLSSFLSQNQTDANSQYAAKRILEMKPEITMKSQLSKVAKGQDLNTVDKTYIQFMAELNRREDSLFSPLAASNNANYDKKVLPYLKELPDQFSYDALDQLAVRDAEAHTKSNDFGIDDRFYKERYLRRLVNLKVSRKIFPMKFLKNMVIYSWFLINLPSQIQMSYLSFHLLIASGWLILDLIRTCMMLRFLKSVINWKVKDLPILQISQKMAINLTLCKTLFIWAGKVG